MFKCWSAEDWSSVFCLLYNFIFVSCDQLLLNERHRTGSRKGINLQSRYCIKNQSGKSTFQIFGER